MKEDLILELQRICDAAGGQHKFENCVEKALTKAKIDYGFNEIYAQAFHLDFRL